MSSILHKKSRKERLLACVNRKELRRLCERDNLATTAAPARPCSDEEPQPLDSNHSLEKDMRNGFESDEMPSRSSSAKTAQHERLPSLWGRRSIAAVRDRLLRQQVASQRQDVEKTTSKLSFKGRFPHLSTSHDANQSTSKFSRSPKPRERKLVCYSSDSSEDNVSNEISSCAKTKITKEISAARLIPQKETKDCVTISSDEENFAELSPPPVHLRCGKSLKNHVRSERALNSVSTAPSKRKISQQMKLKGGLSAPLSTGSDRQKPAVQDNLSEEIRTMELAYMSANFGKLKANVGDPIVVADKKFSFALNYHELSDSESYVFTVHLREQDVDELKVHFGKENSLIAVRPTRSYAAIINDKLGCDAFQFEYPFTKGRYIMFRLKENFKTSSSATKCYDALATLLGWSSIASIGHVEATFILNNFEVAPPRRAYETRSASLASKEQSIAPFTLLVYPSPAARGCISITTEDLKCLREGEYLNDNIIDFYLKYVQQEKLTNADRERCYFFGSYFYTKLTVKGKHHRLDSPQGELVYQQVKQWTKNVDLFEKDFVFVPVNEHSHWYLVVICYPGMDFENDATSTREQCDDFYPSPCIILFDSLSVGGRNYVFTLLRRYLANEWSEKRPHHPVRDFNRQSMRGSYARVPGQTNGCDCGLFVLQYVESFFESPIRNFTTAFHCDDWFSGDKVSMKRTEIVSLVHHLAKGPS